MSKLKRPPFIYYQDAFDGFVQARKELNDSLAKGDKQFLEKFEEYKEKAKNEDPIAMDVLAYFYKSGADNALPENYMRYISWEFVAAARGNELAIEKLQFLIVQACYTIMESEHYQTIKYKNDITDSNVLYVLGKNISKIIVRDFLKAYPVDLVLLQDDYAPFQAKYNVTLRKYIDDAIKPTIDVMRS